MLNRMIQSLLDKCRLSRYRFTDPVLGRLTPLEHDQGWQVKVETDGGMIRIEIGGYPRPSEALVAQARDILRDCPSFKVMVHEFLEQEKRKFPSWLAEEIESLRIEVVCFWWPDRPDNGTIYFAGKESPRVWYCDYIGRKPRGLGFDR